jgi:hypothetical protein
VASEPSRCLNCEAELIGPYCALCGQRAQPLRLTLRSFVAGWFKEIFEADGRLARTVKPMFLRPGFLAREYLEGRRVAYTSPLKLFIFAAVVGFLVLKLFYSDEIQINWDLDSRKGGNGIFDHQMQLLARLGPREAAARLQSGIYENAPTVLALLIPFAAGLLKIMYWRRKYVEHVVFALHQHAVSLLILVPFLLTRLPPVALTAVGLCALHFLFALKTTYQRSWPVTVLVWALALTGYFFLAIAGGLATLMLTIVTA